MTWQPKVELHAICSCCCQLLLVLAALNGIKTTAEAVTDQVLWVPTTQHSCRATCGQYSDSSSYTPVQSPAGSARDASLVCAVKSGWVITAGATAAFGGCSYFDQGSNSAATQSTGYMCLCASSSTSYSWSTSPQACQPGHQLPNFHICAFSTPLNQYTIGYVDWNIGGPSYCRTSRGSSSYGFLQLCTAGGGQLQQACAGVPDLQVEHAETWDVAACSGRMNCSALCLSGEGSVTVRCSGAGFWSRTVEGRCSGGTPAVEAGQAAGNCRGSWGPYSRCSKPCGGGQQKRTYTTASPAAPGGRPCPYRNGRKQTRACNTKVCVDADQQDCRGVWSKYGRCSKPCGGGRQVQTYSITLPARNGGTACKYADGQARSRACNTQVCGTDCVGSWVRTAPCNATCGSGWLPQRFQVTAPAANGGRECQFRDGATRSVTCSTGIPCGSDCAGSWSGWGPCGGPSACGNSTQTSVFLVTSPAEPGGAPCGVANGTTRTQPCDTGVPCGSGQLGSLAVGGSHTCYVNGDQVLKCVGGINEYSKSVIPGGSTGVRLLGVGASQSCAVNNQGFVCWEGIIPYTAYSIPTAFDSTLDAIAVGGTHICGKRGGNLFCFGGNGYQQANVPAALNGIVKSVSAGYFHTCVVTTANNAACFGRNDNQQTAVPAVLSGKASAVCAGSEHTCVLTTDSTVVCFGNNEFGQVSVPSSLAGQQVSVLSCGYYHSCVVLAPSGSVVCWGNHQYKQSSVPAGVIGAVSVGAGGVHTCALYTGGKITCWGDDMFDQSYN